MGSQLKSVAAKVNAQSDGLINQRTGGKSHEQQRRLIALAARHPGYTATQLSWICAGFTVDQSGHCQPAALFAQMNEFFNFKRRLPEVCCAKADIEKRPRAKLVYGKAVNNPYTESGGQGVYVIDGRRVVSVVGDQPTIKDDAVTEKLAAPPSKTPAEFMAEIGSMLDD